MQSKRVSNRSDFAAKFPLIWSADALVRIVLADKKSGRGRPRSTELTARRPPIFSSPTALVSSQALAGILSAAIRSVMTGSREAATHQQLIKRIALRDGYRAPAQLAFDAIVASALRGAPH